MKTVPLYGKKAAGRVTRVDDGDYEFAIQHRWHVTERPETATRRANGPYAVTGFRKPDGKKSTIQLHTLLTGWPLVDHIDHDGLNNQRHNLRPATTAQNGQNSRRKITASSQFKGITWDSWNDMWKATIETMGKSRNVLLTPVEIEAAYAYDAAARDLFGEFACVNFPEGPTEAMREHWRAEREARAAILDAASRAARSASRHAFWAQREPKSYVCGICGGTFESRAVNEVLYCGPNCRATAARRRRGPIRSAKPEPRACVECGREFQPTRHKRAQYCSQKCRMSAHKRRRGDDGKAEAEGRLF